MGEKSLDNGAPEQHVVSNTELSPVHRQIWNIGNLNFSETSINSPAGNVFKESNNLWKESGSTLPQLDIVWDPQYAEASQNQLYEYTKQLLNKSQFPLQECNPFTLHDDANALLQQIDAAHNSGKQSGIESDARALSVRFRKTYVPEQYRDDLIAEALKLAGHKVTASEIENARALIEQESNFNAGCVNNWDSNWQAGHPSVGWAQTIGPTFRAYHVPGHGDIWNPLDNLAAGIRYADDYYGSLDAEHNGLRWVARHRSRRGLGY